MEDGFMADDLDVLEAYGIPVRKLANMIRTVQALTGEGLSLGPTIQPKRRGRPPGSRGPGRPAKGPGRPAGASGNGRRARGTFNVTKDELRAMKAQGLTGKAIAEKHGVSLATVQNHLRKFGLTSSKRGRPAKAAGKRK